MVRTGRGLIARRLAPKQSRRGRSKLGSDRNEADFDAPIVSVSLGLPAAFLFGGLDRVDPQSKVPLSHGDVVVWGGPTRLVYHGVRISKVRLHPKVGR